MIDAIWFCFWVLVVPCGLMVLYAEYIEPWIEDRGSRIRHRRRMARRRRMATRRRGTC